MKEKQKHFQDVDPKKPVAQSEREVLDFWEKDRTFKKSLKNRKDAPRYTFYDGPPFATGTPHYGHFVPNLLKDVVPRYWTMRGKYVERKWGWDCHGLPIENIVEKEMGSQAKKDIEAMGVEKFNELCRSKVLGYTDEWKKVIGRLGRWADMDDAYRTMDPEYMESVWWVFRSLYDKGLLYEAYRSMHICPRCETTLSQSEVAEGYKDVKDLSVVAKFELLSTDYGSDTDVRIAGSGDIPRKSALSPRESASTYVLAWTTTPWTLPGNVALAINPSISYFVFRISGGKEKYIAAKERVQDIVGDKEYEVVEEIKGKDLVGLEYVPLFDSYVKDEGLKNRENAAPATLSRSECGRGWKIYAADFVTTEEGTGVVHIAPAFGEDDMNLGKEENLPFVQHVGMDGIIKDEVKELAGMHVKPTDDHMKTDVEVIKYLAGKNLLFSKAKYEHSYPHCWRCDTPLLNYATSSWFVNVTKIKKQLLENAKDIHWVPGHIKEGRFGKWLEGARDWSISRQRFWASVLPVWKCEKCDATRVLGSVMEEAGKFNGVNRLYLVRHGEAKSNVENFLDSEGNPENILTDKGVEQIQRVAKELKNKNIDAIITSPLVRTKQSAEILAKALDVEVVEDDRLRETGFGEFNGKSVRELRSRFASLVSQGKTPNEYGVETFNSVKSRMQDFLGDVNDKHRGKTIAVVAHADSVLTLHGLSKGMSDDEIEAGWFPKNAEVRSVFSKTVDLHKHVVDKIELECECGGVMRRIPDVLDTWFDSGSMPYAQLHYPFENAAKFEDGFPAQFIGEAVDQTRAWFYYLHVLAGALKKERAFDNVIVNGIIQAEDGKKMSKKLKNYPDPMGVIEKYGADPLRMYILSSPVVMSENINFSEKEIGEISRGMFRMLRNTYSFFVMYANVDNWRPQESATHYSLRTTNLLDRWIVSELNVLAKNVNEAMEKYELARAARYFTPFVDDLSNWYVRRSRKRFWKSENDGDKEQAYATLHHVLVELSKLLAPFAPFISEEIFRNLTACHSRGGGNPEILQSVHLCDYPQADGNLIDEKLNEEMKRTREIITEGLQLRAKAGIKVRQPLASLKVKVESLKFKEEMQEIVKEEMNVKNVVIQKDGEMVLDTEITKELKLEGQAREIIRAVQEMRKKAGYNVDDRIQVSYKDMDDVFAAHGDMIAKETLATKLSSDLVENPDLSQETKIDEESLVIAIKK